MINFWDIIPIEVMQKKQEGFKEFETSYFPTYITLWRSKITSYSGRTVSAEFNLVLFAFRFLIFSIREKRIDVTLDYIVTRDKTQDPLYIKSCPLMEFFDYEGIGGGRRRKSRKGALDILYLRPTQWQLVKGRTFRAGIT